ncbi:hypothetical protein C0991_005343 [Blastosporella zonata]|nr:hypothetical protein C0991_005343 [Blastosporella zonata]
MTRSALSPRGPEVAKKQFRANAKAQGLTFRAAAEARNLLPKPKAPVAPGMGRRTHGKMDHLYWNGRSFVVVGDGVEDPCYCNICNVEFEPPYVMGSDGTEPPEPVLDSLLAIARPVKPKGVARNFEIVDSVTRVIALEDDTWWQDKSSLTQGENELWEEWDEAYQECDFGEESERKPTYSAVVEKGNKLPEPS